MFKRGDKIEFDITDYAFGGKGISKINTDSERTLVFIPNTFPGQRVQAIISSKKKKHTEAKLLEIISRSPIEIPSEYQEISGAPYIYIPVNEQEKVKKQSTIDTFSRLSGIKNVPDLFDEFISAPDHYYYRNKMEYSFSCIEHCLKSDKEIDNAFALGFKRRGTWWKVESLNKPSGLFDKEWEEKLKDIRTYLQNTELPAWHPPQKKGFFRHIVVRKSFMTNELLINLVTSSNNIDHFKINDIAVLLKDLFGKRIAGLLHTINDNVADRAKIENGNSSLIFGNPVIEETILGLKFQISMESFFQTNPKCAERLYSKALDYVFEDDLPNGKVVMDLFCGTGTIGQLLSQRNTEIQIIGVDIVEQAIEDAKRNAATNSIDNIQFFASDAGKFLKQHPEFQGKIETIILDPPRAGIAPKTLQKVIDLGARHIIYISCNPATQARDTATLVEAGFQLEKYSLVDQFPHTGHIESIAKFKRS